MSVAALLARVDEHGFRVQLTPTGPVLTRTVEGATLPEQLLSEVKDHRGAILRHLLAESIVARAGERGVRAYGLIPGNPLLQEFKGRVPERWKWMMAEGDSEWTVLPDAGS